LKDDILQARSPSSISISNSSCKLDLDLCPKDRAQDLFCPSAGTGGCRVAGLVFCTLETGLFGRISEGQLMVRIRHIKTENKKPVLKTFFLNILGCKSKFMGEIFKVRKKCPVSAHVTLTAFIT
jgi:hypothetical protein